MTQIILTHAQWIAAGGWLPYLPMADDDIVIAILNPDGSVQSASWDSPSVDPATRLNDSIPAEDRR